MSSEIKPLLDALPFIKFTDRAVGSRFKEALEILDADLNEEEYEPSSEAESAYEKLLNEIEEATEAIQEIEEALAEKTEETIEEEAEKLEEEIVLELDEEDEVLDDSTLDNLDENDEEDTVTELNGDTGKA